MDLSGGLEASVDEIVPVSPSPDFMEGVNVWLWDDAARIALPRVAVDGMGARWDEAHMVSVNGALPGGRNLMLRGTGKPHDPLDAQGRPRVRGAGPLRFECLDPFRRWQLSFEGAVGDTTVGAQIAHRFGGPGAIPEPGLPLSFQIEMEMTAPPWILGTREPEGATLSTERRLEQLCRAQGEVVIDGVSQPFSGGGLRIHRTGTMQRSDYSDWLGHVWMSARFPSGRAFGVIHFHPRPDGSLRYHEGWLLDGAKIAPAKFVDAPWKRDWVESGEDVSFSLRSPAGTVAIEAETVMTTVNPVAQPPAGGAAFPSTQQGVVRFRWDGEEAYGMLERSSPLETREAS